MIVENIILLYRKLNFSFRYNCRGIGGLQAIPQGVTGSNCNEKEQLRPPEGRSPYGQDRAGAKRVAILYEDDSLLVVNKPAGILTVPTPKKEKHTLTAVINNIFKDRGLNTEVFPCHRLDREASGLIIYAKNMNVQEIIMEQFKKGQVKKKYIAFIQGLINRPNGIISFPIENKKAITKYKLLQRRKGYSIIEIEPSTGRTNQIRIHFKMIGHPLLGERKFAFGKDFHIKFKRVALHASEIQFVHPISGRILSFSSRLPDDMNKLIGSLNR